MKVTYKIFKINTYEYLMRIDYLYCYFFIMIFLYSFLNKYFFSYNHVKIIKACFFFN
jgi:hypothetical protein